ncbi:sugar phosphate isomerase/epimerase [Pontibacter sp. SGAir0037]|uniref:sugar phosphate isomerase/epimerase family protein n=1 Tax=Pontibacter sp. SGAir0037 TaxID=2571030 RepID=UPI0010CD3E03|nr:sugar phosphate isomerase/epimerase [Pontibacter sp. SGAir0037]QCR22022.1 sugar phosphate isomerase/epimerase [Pontibacter sp. SGAir0037]
MTTRRSFLQQAGMLSAGVFLAPSLFGCKTGNTTTDKEVGIQLYTLREQISKDVNGVIGKVAEAGYKNVETYGYSTESKFWGLDPKAFKQLMDSNGLKSASGHYDFNGYFRDGNDDVIKSYIEAGSAIGQTYITAPYIIEPLRPDADAYKGIAEKLNRAAELCKSANMQLAYHNHDFEFQSHGGTTGYEILLSETDADLVKMELDLYWVVRAGLKPQDLFQQNPGRYVMWHVKDMDKASPNLNTEVGAGSINYKEIFEHAKQSGVQYYFVEQENFAMDPYASIQQSINYVKSDLMK